MGVEAVAREDVMEAIEREKFGFNDKQLRPITISKELGKMFPWMPSLMGKNDTRRWIARAVRLSSTELNATPYPDFSSQKDETVQQDYELLSFESSVRGLSLAGHVIMEAGLEFQCHKSFES